MGTLSLIHIFPGQQLSFIAAQSVDTCSQGSKPLKTGRLLFDVRRKTVASIQTAAKSSVRAVF